MYKVYLLKRTRSGAEVIKESRTETPSPTAAGAAFWELRNNAAYAGQAVLLLMTKNKEKLNVHRFDGHEGEDQYIKLGEELRFT